MSTREDVERRASVIDHRLALFGGGIENEEVFLADIAKLLRWKQKVEEVFSVPPAPDTVEGLDRELGAFRKTMEKIIRELWWLKNDAGPGAGMDGDSWANVQVFAKELLAAVWELETRFPAYRRSVQEACEANRGRVRGPQRKFTLWAIKRRNLIRNTRKNMMRDCLWAHLLAGELERATRDNGYQPGRVAYFRTLTDQWINDLGLVDR